MSFKQAALSLQGFFNTNWNNQTSVAWPDVHFTPPATSWVRYTAKNNIGRQASTGSPGANYYRRQGIITVQCFGKPANEQGTGSAEARTLADKVADIYMDQRLAGFIFTNVNAKDIGPDVNGWYQWNVTIEYQYDIIS